MILNFVTEIWSNFLELKIMFWILNFVLALKIMFWILNFITEICSNFLEIKNKVLVLITFLEPYRQNEASLVQNNEKFYMKPILLLS